MSSFWYVLEGTHSDERGPDEVMSGSAVAMPPD
jgi:hypothetical protein